MTVLDHLINFMRRRRDLHNAVEIRYIEGLRSYGVKVRTDKRKARIIAELNAMGIKPRVRRSMGRRNITQLQYVVSIREPKRMQSPRWINTRKWKES